MSVNIIAPPAHRAWHCGTCYFELVAFGSDGDMTCESCGFVYRPDGDGHAAPCIGDGDEDGSAS